MAKQKRKQDYIEQITEQEELDELHFMFSDPDHLLDGHCYLMSKLETDPQWQFELEQWSLSEYNFELLMELEEEGIHIG